MALRRVRCFTHTRRGGEPMRWTLMVVLLSSCLVGTQQENDLWPVSHGGLEGITSLQDVVSVAVTPEGEYVLAARKGAVVITRTGREIARYAFPDVTDDQPEVS